VSLHTERLASMIKRVTQQVLDRELTDPRLDARLTIMEVKVHASGNTAVISIVVTPESRERLAMKAIESATAHIRRRVGMHMPDTRLPNFQFRLDKGARREAAALDAIARIEAERRELEQAKSGVEDAGADTEPTS